MQYHEHPGYPWRMLIRMNVLHINRGSTFTVLQAVGRAVQELLQKYNTNAASPAVGIVSLNGLIHNEEKAAFREIARQLCT